MITVKPASHINGQDYEQAPIMGRYSYAWVSDDNSQVYPFSKCRETLAQIFMYIFNDFEAYKIYPKVSIEKTRILIAFSDNKNLGLHLEQALDFLHQIESQLGLVQTTIDQVEGLNPGLGAVYLIEGSKRWQLSSPMLSLYMLILRNGFVHDKGSSYTDTLAKPSFESNIHVGQMISFLIEKKYWEVFGKDQKLNWDMAKVGITPYMGVLGFMFLQNTANYPHWLIPLEVKEEDNKVVTVV